MIHPELSISVIICAYTEKRLGDLFTAIKSVQQQTRQAREIIVVIDYNPVLLVQVQKQLPDVIVIANSGVRGLSGARNTGISKAKGQIVAFLDDDAIAAPDWLLFLTQGFAHPQVLGIGGRVVPYWPGKDPTWFPEEFLWVVGCTYRGLPQTVASIRNPIGANMAFRRSIFASVGGFRSDIGRVGTLPVGCEETELCIRSRQYWPKHIFLYQPEACVEHHVPINRTTWHYFCTRCYSEGISKAVVTSYVGAKDSLASERIYILHTLPQGILRNVIHGFFRLDFTRLARAGAIVIGLAITVVGYGMGRISSQMKKSDTIVLPKMTSPGKSGTPSSI